MIRPVLFRRWASFVCAIALTVATVFAATDRKPFATSSTLRLETRQLIILLEQVHYNRDKVSPVNYAEVIPDYMGGLDGQRLFFLGSDKADFEKRYASSLYYNVHDLGNIDAAYDIFYTYDNRTQARILWIFEELKKDFDFSTPDFYRIDRSKSEWPQTMADADKLWRERLKFELLTEMLNKKTLAEAKDIVRKRYERTLKTIAEFEGEDLSELFLSSITRLYDPHSTYFSATTFEDFGIQMKLKLVGIGALLGIDDDICTVKEIIPGGPADLDKRLKPEDKIIAVAQPGAEPVEVIGVKLRKIVDMIRGDKGTTVRLLVQPANAVDNSVRKEIVLTRDVVKLNSARAYAAVFDLPTSDGKSTLPIGVITLPAFYGSGGDEDGDEKTSSSKDVSELLKRLQGEGVQGVVLDLRRNGGGLLSEAIATSGLFIGSGPIVQVKDYESHINVDGDDNPHIAYTGPLAVLVDRFSASASEIVAGALQSYGRAIVIGDSSTHGKGTVQNVIEMKNIVPALLRSPAKTGAAKLTIQKFYLPNGASTQMKGVIPDIVLPSIEDFIPGIGESDLPHALVWDEIPPSFFDGKPLSPQVVAPLREASLRRQAELEEFTYLRKNVDWFKTRQEQKLVSLNLDDRKKQKAADDAFQKEMKAERERLAKSDFPSREIRLTPKPPPRIKAKSKKDGSDEEEDDPELSTDEDENSVKGDVHLREALRVVADALQLGHDPKFLAGEYAPLTVQTIKRGS
ncbi:MAG TPA: carboxy terminal-processing peptidase [Opitutaceae bacterium]|nr:carboxy terminal-processing peptidase [Opitutaceae bacterium]